MLGDGHDPHISKDLMNSNPVRFRLSYRDRRIVVKDSTSMFQLQKKKEKLYCCFIDFRKCFDSIYRDGLWNKLLRQGIDGKNFKVIRSIYDAIK